MTLIMDLVWSLQRPDQLVTWGQDIKLYQVEECEPGVHKIRQDSIRLSNRQAAGFVAKLNDFSFIKVIDLYPGHDTEGFLAIGLVNGKVVLTSFLNPSSTSELIPKQSRQVFSLQWNRNSPNFLAAGFEKSKQDYGVHIWDINVSNKPMINGDEKPLIELGHNETAHSVAWVYPKSILVGMNGKHLKLFDLRESQPKLSNTAATKAVYGITIDHLFPNRVVSYSENQAFVWDMRNFEKPFVVLNHAKPLAKVGWCPRRAGLLACLEKESPFLSLYDVHHASTAAEESEPAVLERRLTPAYSEDIHLPSFVPRILSSFAWQNTEGNVLTTCTSSGVLWNSIVYERTTLNWSSLSTLGWTNGKKLVHFVDNTDKVKSIADDISVKMQKRAINRYGLSVNIRENGDLVDANDHTIKNLWNWLDYCKATTESDGYRVSSIQDMKYPGATSVLHINKKSGSTFPSLKSDVIDTNAFDFHRRTYRSEERSFVQQLCGWSASYLSDNLISPTRKAAIAIFNIDIKRAISVLNESNNSIISMAIAGCTDNKSSLWRELAQTNCNQLQDPYIRAIFSFLTQTEHNYSSILNDKELLVGDRLGFACSFLSDNKLLSYVEDLATDLTKKGDLDGILLTGMCPAAFPLLQNYLNNTADIQTVALAIIHTMASEISNFTILKLWTDRYRDLLDSWKLWEIRAEFDILKNTSNASVVPKPEVSVSCNFCGKSISTAGMSAIAKSQLYSRFSSTNSKYKPSCCPSCRKPLPRCSICLMHMGTILGSSKELQSELPALVSMSPTNEAISWYAWCQSCKHGGHTIHLQNWFESQPECPVSGCVCKCMTLDRVADIP